MTGLRNYRVVEFEINTVHSITGSTGKNRSQTFQDGSMWHHIGSARKHLCLPIKYRDVYGRRLAYAHVNGKNVNNRRMNINIAFIRFCPKPRKKSPRVLTVLNKRNDIYSKKIFHSRDLFKNPVALKTFFQRRRNWMRFVVSCSVRLLCKPNPSNVF